MSLIKPFSSGCRTVAAAGSFALLIAISLLASSPALSEGTRSIHPAGANGNRAVMDVTGGDVFGGVARARQFLYVYAEKDEVILLGSRNMGHGTADIFVYNPQSFGPRGDETIPASEDFACSSQSGKGEISGRDAELAGPNSADGSATVTNGFDPCSYKAPETGIYGVLFTGAGGSADSNYSASISSPAVIQDYVSAWDVTVRSDETSLDDLDARVFTYSWAIRLDGNARYLHNDLYLASVDGYRYRQTLHGIDPNRAAFYANTKGFIDTDGSPLYHNMRGTNYPVSAGPSFDAGVVSQPPEFPIFFSDIDPAGANAAEVEKVLNALSIPLETKDPVLQNSGFVGNLGGNQSSVSGGGEFTFDTENAQTYEIVISHDGANFDPADPTNRVLTGTAHNQPSSNTVLWNGLDNNGDPFPVGSYDFRVVGRNGEIHFPMVDVEGNVEGGPTLTKLNGSQDSIVYYDDRGYTTANGTTIGELNGHLCGAASPISEPAPTHSLIGVDSSDSNVNGSGKYYRWWTGSSDTNNDCANSTDEFFGTAKNLDLWSHQITDHKEGELEIIAPAANSVDVTTQVNVSPAVQHGDTVNGTFVFKNVGLDTATGVSYHQVNLGNSANPATCPGAVSFSLVPSGVTPTYNDAPDCSITFAGMPSTLATGESLTFNFNYDVVAGNPGPIPIDTQIDAANENADQAPNDASDETIVSVPDIELTKTIAPDESPYGLGEPIGYQLIATNTGAMTLTNVMIVDPDADIIGPCSPVQPAVLSPGDTLECPASHVVTQADLDNGSPFTNTAEVAGRDPKNDEYKDDDSAAADLDANSALGLVKSVTSGAGPYAMGDTIGYELVANNTGSQTLTDVSISDPDATITSCVPTPPATLAPAETLTCQANHVVTQADINAGSPFVNTATAVGDDPDGNEVGDTDDAQVDLDADSALGLVKSVTSSGEPYAEGDTITYELVATNTGSQTLTDATISDPDATITSCTPSQPASLAPSETLACEAQHTVTQADLDAGTPFTNTATTSGNDPAGNPVSDDDSADAPLDTDAGIMLDKTVTSAGGAYGEGDSIAYELVATNTGTVTLSGVEIADPDATITGCTPSQPATLAPAETLTCQAEHEVTQADLDSGTPFTNTATAAGDDPDGNPVEDDDSADVPVDTDVGIALDKTVTLTGEPYGEGDVITYELIATNTGTVTLTDVEIFDPDASISTCTPSQPASLAPTETLVCDAEHTVTQADLDSGTPFSNTATAAGEDPDDNPVEDDDSADAELDTDIGIKLDKAITSSGEPYGEGDTIAYELIATNTGSISLSNVEIVDNDATITSCAPAQPASLSPGDTLVCEAEHDVTQADLDAGSPFTNTATTSGEDQDGNEVTDDDSADAGLDADPDLTLDKQMTSSGEPYGEGDVITYELVATNTGSQILSAVEISDPDATITSCTPSQPTTLAPTDTLTCQAEHDVTVADLDAGSPFTNTATTTGNDPDDNAVEDSDTAEAQLDIDAGIRLEKTITSSGEPYAQDDTIAYELTATNTGVVTLANVEISDPDAVINSCTPSQPATLAPSDTLVCEAEHTVERADLDAGSPFTNTATVGGDDPDGNPVEDEDSADAPLNDESSIVLVKSVSTTGPYDPGDTVTYAFEVTNTGGYPLENVVVDDPMLGGAISCTPDALAPGESADCGPADYVLTASDQGAGRVENVATVSGEDDGGNVVDDSDSVTVSTTPPIPVPVSSLWMLLLLIASIAGLGLWAAPFQRG